MKPRIGITPALFPADPKRVPYKGKGLFYCEEFLPQLVMNAGGYPLLIPVGITDIVDAIDGLILQGGADIAPGRYGEEPINDERHGDSARDAVEFELFRAAFAAGKPILGVCRGHQLINVAMGGSLYQDISLQRPDSLVHRDWDVYEQLVHPIRWNNGEEAMVNSVHAQGIKELGADLRSDAVAPDGVIEAVSLDSKQYVRGV